MTRITPRLAAYVAVLHPEFQPPRGRQPSRQPDAPFQMLPVLDANAVKAMTNNHEIKGINHESNT